MGLKKWMSTALIISLVVANTQGMEHVKGFTSLDYVKNEGSVLNEQEVDVTSAPTATPGAIGSYYVTYIDGEEEIHVGCYEEGKTTTITLDEPNERDNYEFLGWKNYKGDVFQPGQEVSIYDISSATFTAVWEGIPHADYNINYTDDLNGTHWSAWYPVVKGNADFTLEEPQPTEGYVFVGWRQGENIYQPGECLSLWDLSGNTFTAVWEKEDVTPEPTPTSTPHLIADYSVTYIDGEERTQTGWYPAGRVTTITLKSPEPKEGYRFVGWEDYKGNIYQPGDEVGVEDMPTATFTAVWEKETVTPVPSPTSEPTSTPHIIADYPITYIDGEERTQTGWYPAGTVTTITLKSPEPKEGYRFVGWEDYRGDIYQPGDEVNLEDVPTATFIAVWEKEDVTPEPTPTSPPYLIADYPVTYIDGEERTQAGWYPAGRVTTITLDSPKPKEGFVFVGWKDHLGNIFQPGDEVGVKDMPSATFTAVWEKAVETVTPSAIPVETVTPGAIPVETVTPGTIPGAAPSITPTKTPKPTSKPTGKPVVKKAKVKITTSAKKKFVAGKKYTIKAKRTNTNKKIQWSVSNIKIATIGKSTGVLKAKKPGKVTITVTCGKIKDKIKIVIKKK